MRILLQRVAQAWVEIGARSTDVAGPGLLALVGFGRADHAGLLAPMADKMLGLRVFEDEQGKMNLCLGDRGGDLVLVSQFTLYADLRRGRRPGFSDALEPAAAALLFERFVDYCAARVARVIRGEFGASMRVHLVNDGPVTLLLDSDDLNLNSASSPA